MKTIPFTVLAAAFMLGTVVTVTAESGVPKGYPLTKCPVSGETYGEGGMKAYKVSHDGTDVWLCCKNCKKDFDKEPAKFTQAVKDAAPKK